MQSNDKLTTKWSSQGNLRPGPRGALKFLFLIREYFVLIEVSRDADVKVTVFCHWSRVVW